MANDVFVDPTLKGLADYLRTGGDSLTYGMTGGDPTLLKRRRSPDQNPASVATGNVRTLATGDPLQPLASRVSARDLISTPGGDLITMTPASIRERNLQNQIERQKNLQSASLGTALGQILNAGVTGARLGGENAFINTQPGFVAMNNLQANDAAMTKQERADLRQSQSDWLKATSTGATLNAGNERANATLTEKWLADHKLGEFTNPQGQKMYVVHDGSGNIQAVNAGDVMPPQTKSGPGAGSTAQERLNWERARFYMTQQLNSAELARKEELAGAAAREKAAEMDALGNHEAANAYRNVESIHNKKIVEHQAHMQAFQDAVKKSGYPSVVTPAGFDGGGRYLTPIKTGTGIRSSASKPDLNPRIVGVDTANPSHIRLQSKQRDEEVKRIKAGL